jgi:hypothetical protein
LIDVAAQAHTRLEGARVETPVFINRSYRTAVRAATAAQRKREETIEHGRMLREAPVEIES